MNEVRCKHTQTSIYTYLQQPIHQVDQLNNKLILTHIITTLENECVFRGKRVTSGAEGERQRSHR